MTNQAITNSFSDLSSFKEQINEKIIKAKSILTCIMFAKEIDSNTTYHALWVIDEYLDAVTKLCNAAT